MQVSSHSLTYCSQFYDKPNLGKARVLHPSADFIHAFISTPLAAQNDMVNVFNGGPPFYKNKEKKDEVRNCYWDKKKRLEAIFKMVEITDKSY